MYFYKTIVFDLDGTLFKTDTVFVKALNEVCMARGVPVQSEAFIKGLIGRPMTEICRIIFGQDLTDIEVENIRSEVRRIESSSLKQLGSLYEDIHIMLDNLKADNYNLCICSNGSIHHVENILNAFSLKDKFSIIKSRIEGLSKAQLIKQILEESKCCSAIVVGDTDIDCEAAAEAGCLSIGVSYGYGNNIEDVADFIVHRPIDIYNTIVKINSLYRDIATYINKMKSKDKPLIVGINGVDTSGKTTFTKELNRYLIKSNFKTQIIHIDDFHNPSYIRNKDSDPVASYYKNAFNLDCIKSEILEPIMTNKSLNKKLLLLDLNTDKYDVSREFIVKKDTVVLIEGVLLYREPIDKYFDIRIYLDISFEEVINRATRRDAELFGGAVKERYLKKYIPVQEYYIRTCMPKDKSHIVIDNEDYRNPKIKFIKYKGDGSYSKVKLVPMEEKYLTDIKEMYFDAYTQEMLGMINYPDMNSFADENSICYAIINENNEFSGIVELFNISWKNKRAELSITLKTSHRGKGYGYEAIQRILDIGFYELGFNRIWLRVLESNKKAIDLYQRIGFIKEGICREESLRKGEFLNQIQMSILKKEWMNMKD